MRAGYERTFATANAGASTVGTFNPRNGTDHAPRAGSSFSHNGDAKDAVCTVLKAIFGAKPWAVLMDMFGLSEGAAKKKIHGERELSTDELRAILHREDGHHVLAAMMAGSMCHWWSLASTVIEADLIKQAEAANRRRLTSLMKGAVDADRSLSAAIHDAETANFVHDENFHRPHRDAVRAVVGLSHRSLDAAKKGVRR